MSRRMMLLFCVVLIGFAFFALGNLSEVARAIGEGTPTPAPLQADQLTVVSVEEIDLVAGPGGTSAYLAPDGERFAHLNWDEICIYTVMGEQQQCTNIGEQLRPLGTETVRWSPDSRYLVMTEEFFGRLDEPDLWILDADTGELTNITDDGVEGTIFDSEVESGYDVVPRWSSDGSRLLFMRYTGYGTDIDAPIFFTIAPDGSSLERIGEMPTTGGFPVSALDWSPDGTTIAFNFWSRDNEADNGVWIGDIGGSDFHQLTQIESDFSPTELEFSADGNYLLAHFPWETVYSATFDPEFSVVQAISVDSGEIQLLNEELHVMGAGWSPDGSALAYIMNQQYLLPDESGLYISSGPGEPGRLVLQGFFSAPTSLIRQTLTWADNNTILLSRSPEPGIVIVRLE